MVVVQRVIRTGRRSLVRSVGRARSLAICRVLLGWFIIRLMSRVLVVNLSICRLCRMEIAARNLVRSNKTVVYGIFGSLRCRCPVGYLQRLSKERARARKKTRNLSWHSWRRFLS